MHSVKQIDEKSSQTEINNADYLKTVGLKWNAYALNLKKKSKTNGAYFELNKGLSTIKICNLLISLHFSSAIN